MAEPLSTGATASVAGWGVVTSALSGFITSVDYSIVFGAFAGSIYFVVIARSLSRLQTLGYFVFGYTASIFGAGVIADIIEDRINYHDKPLDALAAVLISGLAMQGYFWLKNGGLMRLPFFKRWLGGER